MQDGHVLHVARDKHLNVWIPYKEELLQKVTTKAFNQTLNDKDGFTRQMQENIAKAITTADTMSPDGI